MHIAQVYFHIMGYTLYALLLKPQVKIGCAGICRMPSELLPHTSVNISCFAITVVLGTTVKYVHRLRIFSLSLSHQTEKLCG